MSKQKKTKVIYDYRKFPFDKLSIVTEGEGLIRNKEFKSVSMSTRVDGGDYGISFEHAFKAGPIIYLVFKDDPNKPTLRLRFTLNPRWEDKGPDGRSLRKESENGKNVREFWVKYRERLIELLKALPKDTLIELIGAKRAANIEESLNDVVSFPDVEGKEGVPDEEKSMQFKCMVWTGNYKTMKKPPPREELLMIPGTDIVIYTNIRKVFGDGSLDDGKRIVEYEKLKRFFYCKDVNPNATKRYFALTAEPVLNAPSLSYCKTGEGSVKIPLGSLNITNQKMFGGDGSLSDAELEKMKKRRMEEMDELGFSPNDYESVTKKPKLEEGQAEKNSDVGSDHEQHYYDDDDMSG